MAECSAVQVEHQCKLHIITLDYDWLKAGALEYDRKFANEKPFEKRFPEERKHSVQANFFVTLQEPITRSVQLPYFRATAFSQVGLFLDMPFPLKLLFLVMSSSKSE